MEKIKGKMAQEVSKIEERKGKIDDELKEVQVPCQRGTIHLCSTSGRSGRSPPPPWPPLSAYYFCPAAFGR